MRFDRGLFQFLDSDSGRGEPLSGHSVPYGLETTIFPPLRPTQPQILGKLAGVAVAVGLMVLSIITLGRTLKATSWADVGAALAALPIGYVLLGVLCTSLSYLALTGYDVLGLSYLGRRLAYSRVALGSFLSYAFANTLGFALLTGGTTRYRIYAPAGLGTGDIAILTLICGLTFALSGCLVAALCFVFEPSALGHLIGTSPWLTLVIGLGMLAVLAAYVVWVGTEPRALRWGLRELPLPGARSTIAQLAVGLADMMFASAALHLLLPASADIGFLLFAGVFAVAMTLGLLSHVPGGIGVFETVILLAIPEAPKSELLASLLAFRFVYYFLPFLVAMSLLAWHEASQLPNAHRVRRLIGRTTAWIIIASVKALEGLALAGRALASTLWRWLAPAQRA